MYVLKHDSKGQAVFCKSKGPSDVLDLTPDVKATLPLIVKSASSLAIQIDKKLTPTDAQAIRQYCELGGDQRKLWLFANPGNKSKRARYMTQHTERTAAGIKLAVSYTLGEQASPANEHPAWGAVNYLASGQGHGSLAAIRQLLGEIGDIRYYLAKAGSRSYAADAIADSLHCVPKVKGGFCSALSPEMIEAAVAYLADHRDLDTFCYRLITVAFGRLADNRRSDTFAGSVAKCYDDVRFGIAAGAVASLKLLVTTWAAEEFHPDLFDDAVFLDCHTSDYQKQVAKFRQYSSDATS